METLLFNNKYRIPSARLQHWNYANEAMYFVTICTKNRVHYFGEIMDNPPALQPTEIGKIAHSEWYKSVALRPDMNLELGEFVVMPNHIHGIVIIGTNAYNSPHLGNMADMGNSANGAIGAIGENGANGAIGGRTDAMHRVSTQSRFNPPPDSQSNPQSRTDAMHRVSTHPQSDSPPQSEYANQFVPQSKNLASIMRGYKSAVTTHARKCGIEFDWQPRYHDHVIRSMDEYHRISNYIINNPAKWLNDKFYQL